MGRKIGLVMAMEEEMMLAEDNKPEIMDNEGSAETAMLEASDMDNEVEDQFDEMDTVSDSSDELSKIADVMEKTTESGGMDEQTAEVVEVAIEGIYTRIGVTRRAKMPALESFADKNSKLQATRIAIEDIRTFAAAAYKKIIEAIKAASEFIMNLMKKIFDVNARMKNRAASYKEKVAALSSKEAKEKEIASGSFGKSLALTETTTNFAKDVSVGIERVCVATKKNTTLAEEVAKHAATVSSYGNKTMAEGIVMGAKVGANEGFDAPEDGMVTTRSEVLPGGKAFVSMYSEKPGDGSKIEVMVSDFTPTKPLEFKAEKVKTATAEEMKDITAKVLELSAAVEANKASCDKLISARKSLLDDITSKFAKKTDDVVDKIEDMKKYAMAFNKLSKGFMTSFNKYSVTAGMNALNYVQKSMEQYDGKVEAAPAKA